MKTKDRSKNGWRRFPYVAHKVALACATMGSTLPMGPAWAGPMLGNSITLGMSFKADNVVASGGIKADEFIGIKRSASAGFDVGALALKGSVTGSAGLNVAGTLGASTANIGFGGSLSLDLPTYVTAGQQFMIQSDWSSNWGQMSVTGPQASLDIELQAGLDLGAKAKLLGMSRSWDRHYDWTLYSYHASSANAAKSMHYQNAFLEVDAGVPVLKDVGSQFNNGLITSVSSGSFFRGAVDLDYGFTAITGIPLGWQDCMSVIVLQGCWNIDLLDLDLALNASLRRTVAFEPTVMATYTLEDGRVFEMDADSAFFATAVDGYDYGTSFDVQVDYSGGGAMKTTTAIGADIDLELDLIKGSADLDYRWLSCKWLQLKCRWKWKDLVSGEFGPLYEKDWNLWGTEYSLGTEDADVVKGFNTVTASFSIPFVATAQADRQFAVLWDSGAGSMTGNSETSVPEPSPLMLIGGAMAWLGLRRKRTAVGEVQLP